MEACSRAIKLKRISLLNFKGMHELSIDFNDRVTEIYGRNASGKTTIFDAITWLLFGKDSQGRDRFDIKTLDENGVPIPRIPHAVSAVIEYDGQTINLRRELCEKWTKKRGSATEVFTGNEEKRLYNDVPLSVADWKARIAEICDEATFKMITSPSAFSSMDKKAQRQKLFAMAGSVSDEDIAKGNADLQSLLSAKGSRPMEQYKQEIAAAKRRVKQENASLPSRIDERQRDIDALADTDFMALHEQEQALSKQLAAEEEALVNDRRNADEKAKKREDAVRRLSELKERLVGVEYRIKANVNAERYKAQEARRAVERRAEDERRKLAQAEKDAKDAEATINACISNREALIAEWRSIQAETLTFGEDVFVCPTCKRPLDDSDVETKKASMLANFNRGKAARLDDNTKRGRANNEKRSAAESELVKAKAEVDRANKEIAALMASPEYANDCGAMTDVQTLIQSDKEWQQLMQETIEARKAIDLQTAGSLNDFELAGTVIEHRNKLREVQSKLAMEATIEANEKRIDELRTAMQKGAQELADLERIEYLIELFNKAKVEATEGRINDMFTIVKFRLYEQQINGGEVETCEATVNGVPYSSLNNAMRINAGLDIINAICKADGISAPIVIDNAESVNSIMETAGQQIRLYVSDDDKLIIK